MGREIRRVPANWEHPRHDSDHRRAGQFRPLLDGSYDDACREWWESARKWHAGEVDDREKKYLADHPWYWDWSAPPNRECYRETFDSEPTHYQIYETVSEGTPVSPVFASLADMVEWMIQPIDRTSEYNGGADWQCMQGMTREQAEQFVGNGHSVSMMITDGVLQAGHKPGTPT